MTEAAEIHLHLSLGGGERQRRRLHIPEVRDRPDVAIDSNGVDENDGRVVMLLPRLDPHQAVVPPVPYDGCQRNRITAGAAADVEQAFVSLVELLRCRPHQRLVRLGLRKAGDRAGLAPCCAGGWVFDERVHGLDFC